MITGEQEQLVQIVQTHLCPEHGKTLGVAWHAEENCYVIRCAKDHYPDEVTEELSRTREFKTSKLEKVDDSFNLLPSVDLATGERLHPDMTAALVRYADKYKLDAYRGHVVVMYGKPYIGLDGYLYHANKSGRLYQLRSHPLPKEEKELFMIPEDAHAWIAAVSCGDNNTYFTGLGIVTQEEITAKSTRHPDQLRSPVVAAHPWQLAQKRAEWQAMRRAFPIGESENKEKE